MIDYDSYEIEINIRANRRDKKRPASNPKRVQAGTAAALVEPGDSYGFHPTYKSAHHDHGEQQWIIDALGGFYDDGVIDDVLRVVKGGKEASVYCCAAHPSTGVDLIAAKIYRPRMFRNLKNDALYREGRGMVDDEGKEILDQRRHRAVQKKTRFGSQVSITSWIEYEYQTLRLLYEAGIDIPKPFGQSGKAILMEYLGDEEVAAPTLNHVSLSPDEAQPLFDRVMRSVERMLACNRIHADLSAYNILYWDGEIKIIDFPQTVDPRFNPHAAALLARDVERVCQYFARQGVKADAARLADDLWSRFMRAELDI